jgi:hypothetical protein
MATASKTTGSRILLGTAGFIAGILPLFDDGGHHLLWMSYVHRKDAKDAEKTRDFYQKIFALSAPLR